ncbi:MAG: cytochrome c biogenesis heme-transporting ATPase CcmA [Burkholderiales bacterium]
MLTMLGLECVRGSRTLFSQLNVELDKGELLHLRGPNGSGKTSLLRMLCGLTSPTQGEIRWNGHNIRTLGDEYHGAFLYVGHANALKDELSAAENLMTLCALAGEPVDQGRVSAALENIGMHGTPALPAKYLSQGQKRRAALARLALSNRPLWILDEPLAALDRGAARWVGTTLVKHSQNGGMAVVTTHQDLDVAGVPMRELVLGT